MARRHPSPRPRANRVRPPIHFKEKMDFVCVLMVARNVSLRDMESDLQTLKTLKTLKTSWNAEPAPGHSTIWSYIDMLDEKGFRTC